MNWIYNPSTGEILPYRAQTSQATKAFYSLEQLTLIKEST